MRSRLVRFIRLPGAVLRRLVAFALPYVRLGAGDPAIQAELDRAVFGADFLERVGLAYGAGGPH